MKSKKPVQGLLAFLWRIEGTICVLLCLGITASVNGQCEFQAKSLTATEEWQTFEMTSYESSQSCNWLVQVEDTMDSVAFIVIEIDIREGHGYFEVFDGYFFRQILIAPTNETDESFNIMVADTLGFFHLQTSEVSGDIGRGIKVAYFLARDHSTPANNVIASQQPKILSSPSFPGIYPPLVNLMWTIDAGSSENKVMVEVLFVDIQSNPGCSAGSLTLYDSDNTELSNRIIQYCSFKQFPNEKYQSTGRYFTVFFASGRTGARSGHGFYISYRSDLNSNEPDTTTTAASMDWSCSSGAVNLVARPTKQEIYLSGSSALDIDCRWLLSGESEWNVMLDIREFQMTCRTRWTDGRLSVYDGNSETGSLLQQFTCGESVDGGIVVTTSGSAYLHIETNNAFGEVTLLVYYMLVSDQSSVTNNDDSVVVSLEDSIQFISSPNFPNQYPGSSHNVWTINTGGDSTSIHVEFMDLQSTTSSNCSSDSVSIHEASLYDIMSRLPTEIASLCTTDDWQKKYYTFTKQFVWIIFHSDAMGASRGFFLRYGKNSLLTSPSTTPITTSTTTTVTDVTTEEAHDDWKCPSGVINLEALPWGKQIGGSNSQNSRMILDCTWLIVAESGWSVMLQVTNLVVACAARVRGTILDVYDADGSFSLDGAIVTAENSVQYISSINFPSLYGGNLDVIYAIDTEGESAFVEVLFIDMESSLDCSNDNLQIYHATQSEALTGNATVLANLCNGQDWERKYYPVTKQYIGIVFTSNSHGAGRGFLLRYGLGSGTTPTVTTETTIKTTEIMTTEKRTTPDDDDDGWKCPSSVVNLEALPWAQQIDQSKSQNSGTILDCTWLIVAESGWSVMLQVTNQEVACAAGVSGTILDVYDGSDSTGNQLIRFDCESYAKSDIVVASSGSTYIHFQTYSGADMRELQVYYMGVTDKSSGSFNVDGIVGTAENYVQYISSINFPSLYDENLHVTYAIDTSGESAFVEVLFTDIESSLDCSNDHLQIYHVTQSEALTGNPTVLANLCNGQDWERKYYPVTKQYIGIVFTSNSHGAGRGFLLRYGLGSGTTPTVTTETTIKTTEIMTTEKRTTPDDDGTTADPGERGCSEQDGNLRAVLSKQTISAVTEMNTSCSWLIMAKPESSVMLQIHKMEMSCSGQDTVVNIYEGTNEEATLLKEHRCGDVTPSELLIASSGNVYVEFVAVGGVGQKSLEIYYLGASDLSAGSYLQEGTMLEVGSAVRFISSPNFPGEYDGNLQMAWVIDTGIDNSVSVVIEFHDIPKNPGCTTDGVQILEASQADLISRTPKLLGGHCGRANWTRITYRPEKKFLIVGFISGGSGSGKGFLLQYGLGDLTAEQPNFSTSSIDTTISTEYPVSAKSQDNKHLEDNYIIILASVGAVVGLVCLVAIAFVVVVRRKRNRNRNQHIKFTNRLSGHEELANQESKQDKSDYRNRNFKDRLDQKPSWIQMMDDYRFDSLPAWSKIIDTRGSWKK